MYEFKLLRYFSDMSAQVYCLGACCDSILWCKQIDENSGVDYVLFCKLPFCSIPCFQEHQMASLMFRLMK